ncbi:PdaC/SigV domain-containing protein [Sphingomonas aerophila]|uniref:Deacetylase PdaC domain-containing protein n=1 Tax=Sphingomonas aerophila TaxID=1344948 RepID=A0A7W9BBI2_9SPHN|nr:DUF4163 domain-containing protein [Sphingomonas aerophila]MBB5713939.1 hypothetical protein [Sphingomonas aerophila]
MAEHSKRNRAVTRHVHRDAKFEEVSMRIGAGLVAAALPAVPASAQEKDSPAKVSYTYPAQARATPALRRWFDKEGAAFRATTMDEAAQARREAANDGFPFRPYVSDRDWKVVADTPRFLSLSVEGWDYSGGAHGMTMYATFVWDRTSGVRRAPLSFFTSPKALGTAIRSEFCRELDAQRQNKRGGNPPADIPEFSKCIDPLAQTLILGSRKRDRFDRIGILIPPYDAGPYVEGTYEVTLPVTRAVMAAVRPEWRRYFEPGTP